jgi:hypothetical protein
MHVDSLDADRQIGCDALARLALDHAAQDFLLTRGQRFDPLAQFALPLMFRVTLRRELHCTLHAIEHLLGVIGLFDKIDRAMLKRANGHRDIAVTAHEDDRQVRATAIQFGLHVEAARLRHAHVEHEARGAAHIERTQKIGSVRESLRLHTDRIEQPRKRGAHAVVIVDDIN